jgi:exonuclease III
MILDPHCTILNWNVRGLYNLARRQVVREIIVDNACSVVCLQETKLHSVDDAMITATLGQQFLDQYVALPAGGTSGGILIACSKDFYSLSQVGIRQFSVTVTITRRIDSESWNLTGVYGPQLNR